MSAQPDLFDVAPWPSIQRPKPKRLSDRARNLAVVRAAFEAIAPLGATPDQIGEMCGLEPLSVRPRCTELYQLGHVVRTGEMRNGAHVLRRTA